MPEIHKETCTETWTLPAPMTAPAPPEPRPTWYASSNPRTSITRPHTCELDALVDVKLQMLVAIKAIENRITEITKGTNHG